MDDFGRAHAGQPVGANDFRTAVEKAGGLDLSAFFDTWLGQTGLPNREKEKDAPPRGVVGKGAASRC